MRLSIVIPLLNEEANLVLLHQRLCAVTDKLGCQRQIIFVDDGSTDQSARIIGELAATDPTVTGIEFSRNFGHEAASTAGLDHADGDAVVLMDADLQDPPELIEQLVARWRDGFDIVYAVRSDREGESLFKRCTAWAFYRILNLMSDVEIPRDTGDFRLMDRRVLNGLSQCRERARFIRGLVAWTGFKTTAVGYNRPGRHGGETKYNPLKLLWLSLDAAVGFSILPLRMATALGFAVTLVSLMLVCIIVIQKLFMQIEMQGYALLASGLFFLGGVQMLLLGVLGEYIGRIYRESQGRPLYIIRRRSGESDQRPPAK
jgi:polyisoprenyl-phosphate glycosyltransferase